MKNVYTRALSAAFILLLFISAQSIHAQCWSAPGGGVDTNSTYAYRVMAITSYNGNLIAGGLFDAAGGVTASNIAAWNGSSWSALGAGVNSVNFGGPDQESIYAMAVYNNELYVSGVFDTVDGMPIYGLAKWNGTTWSSVPGADTVNGSISSMVVYNGDLYVGGELSSIGSVTANGIAVFNGSTWSGIGNLLYGSSPGVTSLASYNGYLYAGGLFNSAGGVNAVNIAAWNGSTWSALGSGLATTCYCGGVVAIAGYQGDIYAAVGGEDTVNYYSTGSLAKWDGSSWTYLLGEPGTLHYPGDINSLCTYGGRLILSGIMLGIGTDSFTLVAACDGTTLSTMSGNDGASNINFYDQIAAVVDSADGQLYAGGFFLRSGTTYTQNIAEYNCSLSGIHDIAKSNVSIYPNPTNGIVNVSMENGQDASIQIYNLLGEKVFQSKLNNDHTQIDLSGRPSGSYLYRISNENGAAVSAGPIIIE